MSTTTSNSNFNAISIENCDPNQRASVDHIVEYQSGIFNAPAGHGKSMGVIFPACVELIKRNPNIKIGIAVYNNSLYQNLSKEVEILWLNRNVNVFTYHKLGMALLKYNLGKKYKDGSINAIFAPQEEQLKNKYFYAIKKIWNDPKNKEFLETQGYTDKNKNIFISRVNNIISILINENLNPLDTESCHSVIKSYNVLGGSGEYNDTEIEFAIETLLKYRDRVLFEDRSGKPKVFSKKTGNGRYMKITNVAFNDMIHLPVLYGFKQNDAYQYDILFMDEYQDQNIAFQKLVLSCVKDPKNIVYLGDTEQAIFTWNGADPVRVVENIKKINPEIKTFNFNTTYRFGKNIANYVNGLFGYNIESLKTGNNGNVYPNESLSRFLKDTNNGTDNAVILTYKNDSVMELFIECIKRGIPANIAGKDMKNMILNYLNNYKDNNKIETIAECVSEIDKDIIELRDFLFKKGYNKSLVEQTPEFETLKVIRDFVISISKIKNISLIKDLYNEVNLVFSDENYIDDEKANKLIISTSSKAKGLSFKNVAIYKTSDFYTASSTATKPEKDLKEKLRLHYVTITRAKENIYENLIIDNPETEVIENE